MVRAQHEALELFRVSFYCHDKYTVETVERSQSRSIDSVVCGCVVQENVTVKWCSGAKVTTHGKGEAETGRD